MNRGPVEGDLVDQYNFRVDNDFRVNEDVQSHLQRIYESQANAFRLNFSFTMILRNVHPNEYILYCAHKIISSWTAHGVLILQTTYKSY